MNFLHNLSRKVGRFEFEVPIPVAEAIEVDWADWEACTQSATIDQLHIGMERTMHTKTVGLQCKADAQGQVPTATTS